MRKSKLNYFAAIGMVVAIGTAAFTAPKENTNNNSLLWFVKDQASGTYSYDPNGAPPNCPDEPIGPICALAFNEADMPTLPITDGHASSAVQKRVIKP